MFISKRMSRVSAIGKLVVFWIQVMALPIGFAVRGELGNPYAILMRGLKIEPVGSVMFVYLRKRGRYKSIIWVQKG